MRDVYDMSWNVVAWLGEDHNDRDNGKAFQLLTTLSKQMDHITSTSLVRRLETDPGYLGEGVWLALHELVLLPYFERLWIIQELVMGFTAVTLHLGAHKIAWTPFIVGIESLHIHFWIVKDQLIQRDWRRQGNATYRLMNVKSLHLLKKDIKPLTDDRATSDAPWTSLPRLLDMSQSTQATDPRDYVYGMLGMMDPAVSGHIVPDYTMSLATVFVNTAIAAFETAQSLEFLREATRWPPGKGPTWAPDWTWPLRARDGRFRTEYHASGRLRTGKVIFRVDRAAARLDCRAILVDSVAGLGGRRLTRFKYYEDSLRQPKKEHWVSAYGDESATKRALAHGLAGDLSWRCREDTARRLAFLHLPASFRQGRPQFEKQEWEEAIRNEGYYYSWEEFRKANKDLRVAGVRFDEYFEDAIPDGAEEKDWWEGKSAFENMLTWRRIATTTEGYFGWVPDVVGNAEKFQVAVGDAVAVVLGCSTPLLLRRITGSRFWVVGEAYFIGLMAGEAMKMVDKGELTISDISLY